MEGTTTLVKLELPLTTEEGGRYNSLLAVHKCIFFLLAMLGVLLQVKHATGDLPSPFVTDHNSVVMLIADLFAYVGALATVKILQASNNTNIYELINSISLLCGTLALILLVLLLVPPLAVRYVRNKMKELMMRFKGTEEPQNWNGIP